MIVSIWYDVAEQLPLTPGWYVAKKEVSMGDDEVGIGWYKWDGRRWADSELSYSHHANISYWTDVDFDNVSHRPSALTVTEQAAYDDVKEAIEKFNMIRIMTSTNKDYKE